MRLTAKKRKFTIWFLICVGIVAVALTLFICGWPYNIWVTKKTKTYRANDIVYIRRGEKTHIRDVFEEYSSVVIGHWFESYTYSYGARSLTDLYENDVVGDGYNDKGTNHLYLDENGYIQGTRTGVYTFEYIFITNEYIPEGDEKHSYEQMQQYTGHSFTAVICVYEGNESRFQALPDDPKEMLVEGGNRNNYILTHDVEWASDQLGYEISNFYGTLINPYGYTLTWKLDEKPTVSGYIRAFMKENHGYIDGLKIKIENSQDKPVQTDFYGLVEHNFGMIKNCEIEGTVYAAKPKTSQTQPSVYVLPKQGFVFDNTVKMTVYCDGKIYPYHNKENIVWESAPSEWKETYNHIAQHWEVVNNAVYLDAWYYSNDVLARHRVVETVVATKDDNNTCEHLIYGKQTLNILNAKITLKIPQKTWDVAEAAYSIDTWEVKRNSPLEIPTTWWQNVLSPNVKGVGKVLYWLVDGEKTECLDDCVVRKNITVEPCVQYAITTYDYYVGGDIEGEISLWWASVFNADTTLDFSLILEQEEEAVKLYMTLDTIAEVLGDPRNVIPDTIIVGENCILSIDRVPSTTIAFIEKYLDGGGEIIIASSETERLTISTSEQFLTWIA